MPVKRCIYQGKREKTACFLPVTDELRYFCNTGRHRKHYGRNHQESIYQARSKALHLLQLRTIQAQLLFGARLLCRHAEHVQQAEELRFRVLRGSNSIGEKVNSYIAATAVGAMPYCFLNAAEKCDWFLKPTLV